MCLYKSGDGRHFAHNYFTHRTNAEPQTNAPPNRFFKSKQRSAWRPRIVVVIILPVSNPKLKQSSLPVRAGQCACPSVRMGMKKPAQAASAAAESQAGPSAADDEVTIMFAAVSDLALRVESARAVRAKDREQMQALEEQNAAQAAQITLLQTELAERDSQAQAKDARIVQLEELIEEAQQREMRRREKHDEFERRLDEEQKLWMKRHAALQLNDLSVHAATIIAASMPALIQDGGKPGRARAKVPHIASAPAPVPSSNGGSLTARLMPKAVPPGATAAAKAAAALGEPAPSGDARGTLPAPNTARGARPASAGGRTGSPPVGGAIASRTPPSAPVPGAGAPSPPAITTRTPPSAPVPCTGAPLPPTATAAAAAAAVAAKTPRGQLIVSTTPRDQRFSAPPRPREADAGTGRKSPPPRQPDRGGAQAAAAKGGAGAPATLASATNGSSAPQPSGSGAREAMPGTPGRADPIKGSAGSLPQKRVSAGSSTAGEK